LKYQIGIPVSFQNYKSCLILRLFSVLYIRNVRKNKLITANHLFQVNWIS